MSFPSNLQITHSFNADASATGKVDKAKLDETLINITNAYNELLALVQTLVREDGTLRDKIVRAHHIDPAVFE